MLTLIALMFVKKFRHTKRVTVEAWNVDMENIQPSTGTLAWLIEHDFIVGGALCFVAPAIIVMLLVIMLGL
jgi:hypothetical protein